MKVFEDERMLENIQVVVYGNNEVFKEHKRLLNKPSFHLHKIKDVESAHSGKVNVVNVWTDKINIEFGKATQEAGEIALKSLESAVKDLASNKIDVLITAPINKDTIQSDDFNFPGHTEYLSEMSNVEDHLMLLVADSLRVGVVTGHIPIKEVSANLSTEKILSKLNILHDSLIRDFAISRPRIAVLGLNPHAGDNGLLGDEEKEVIIPAIRQAKEEGKLVYGPFGADGFFGSPSLGEFDGIMAMYHDQGLTPFKALAFDEGVNFTAGLPIVRTSPGHGTAYEIAGKNLASPNSFRNAVYLACDIYKSRKMFKEITSNVLEIKPKKEFKKKPQERRS